MPTSIFSIGLVSLLLSVSANASELSPGQQGFCQLIENKFQEIQNIQSSDEQELGALKEMYRAHCEFYQPIEVTEESVDLYSDLFSAKGAGVSQKRPPILAPFLAQHGQCGTGCEYVSWGIWGDARHQAKRSCHNAGEAIDIHAIRCGGVVSAAGSKRFNSYASCMRQKFGVIYGSGDHRDHAHIQLRGCHMISGR